MSKLYERDNKISRTVDPTNKREREPKMKVKNALELLNDLPLEAEICAQWYEKEDMVMGDEPISDELWSEALNVMDKWECSDLRELLQEALFQAKRNLKVKV